MKKETLSVETLKGYLSSKYKGWSSFVDNIIFPIFGEDKFETLSETELLENSPEEKPLAEATGICSIKQVGQIDIGVQPLQIFDVTVSDRVMMERNRVNIQRLIRKVMENYSSAFMLFHYENDTRWDWRFTFCHKKGSQKDVTDSKRYTFLLGPGQSCRTAANNFNKLYENRDTLDMSKIEEAFSVEALTNEFFGKYKEEYDKFVEYITGKRYVKKGNKYVEAIIHEPHPTLYPCFSNNDKLVRDYVKKMLGRIVFLHFLQKKGWLGVPYNEEWGSGDRNFMLNLFKNATEKQRENFLDEVLEGLFAEGLDCNRADKSDLYDTKVEGFRKCRIPYLNGGLFECDYLDELAVRFPAEYFDSLLTMLSQYNFTIDENDPNDAEVGVDPEMLGRIFENLLEDNKDKGAFYTPKEIVQYMCRESLIAYLQTDQNEEDKETIRKFVSTHDAELLGDLKANIEQKLLDVKICDPAIGSGAFPMGLLRELFFCRSAIEPNIIENAANIKRYIIQNNIYGVDIERGAVDIARLRFWLALIVDEKTPEALPNLDFKIMQGNSLLESYEGIDLSKLATMSDLQIYEPQRNLFGELEEQQIKKIFTQTDKLKEFQANLKRYFEVTDHDERACLRQSFDDYVRHTITYTLDTYKRGEEKKIEQILLSTTPTDKQKKTIAEAEKNIEHYKNVIESVQNMELPNSQFFLWHTWFNDVFSRPSKEGFDIVIGNPPYGATLSNTEKRLYRRIYPETQFKIDTYSLFILLSLNLLRENGLCYMIIPNTLLDNYYEEEVRKALLNNYIYEINDLSDKVFDTAVVHSMIFAFGKERRNEYKVRVSTSNTLGAIDTMIPKTYFFNQPQFTLSIRSYEANDLMMKLRKNSIRLCEVLDIRQAIKSGNDKLYITKTKGTEGNYHPILRGKDIKRYSLTDPHLYLLYGKHLACPRSKEIFEQPKILIREAGAEITATYDDNNYYIMSSLYNAILRDQSFSLKYLLGLINSRLFQYIMYKLTFEKTKGAFTKAKIFHYYELPIKACNQAEQQKVIDVVDEILSIKKSTPSSNVESLEKCLNDMIYKLYDLTDEEIMDVEGI